MQIDLKKDFAHPKEPGHFIKVTDFPVSGLTSEQKVVLNRKGNVFFNQGKILEARRLFITTGYSDGLNRVAEKSMEDVVTIAETIVEEETVTTVLMTSLSITSVTI